MGPTPTDQTTINFIKRTRFHYLPSVSPTARTIPLVPPDTPAPIPIRIPPSDATTGRSLPPFALAPSAFHSDRQDASGVLPTACHSVPVAPVPVIHASPSCRPSPVQYRLRSDPLGKLALSSALQLCSGLSFSALCTDHRGPSCLSDPLLLPHSAAPLLANLRSNGAPSLQSTPTWTSEQLDAAAKRGPHKGTLEHIEFMRAEFVDMISAGQWLVLPYSAVRQLPGLRLSPTGVVPQRDRRPRPIVDYTFSGVNAGTKSEAPDAIQFGRSLLRFLQHLNRADTRRGPIKLAKTDISDAFMRVWLDLATIPTMGAILPSYPDEEPIIAFPMILPMGWIDSPNYLCAVTETIADLANARFTQGLLTDIPHRLTPEARSLPAAVATSPTAPYEGPPPPLTASRGPRRPPLNITDVYMDDFLAATQLSGGDLTAARSTLFDCIDSVLRPLEPHDNPCRKEPISVKKLLKGDAAWDTTKTILGWSIDTVRRTVELPPHRLDRLTDLLASIPPSQHRTSRQKWQQLLGEIRSMVLAIPGGRGLFSQLQSVLEHADNPRPTDRLRLSTAVHDQLADWRWLASNLRSRPTRWAEIIDSTPAFLGTVDASGLGMGGTWIPANPSLPPLLWRHQFTPATVSSLLSFANPLGTLTNSDLKQLALSCHPDILTSAHDTRERTIVALSDNTAAVSRDNRGSTSVNAPSSYLCRMASLHQRYNRYRLRVDYLPGVLNTMADDLSRPRPMDPLSPATRAALARDECIVHATLQSSLSPGRHTAAATYWLRWQSFCQQHGMDPILPQGPDAVYWLEIFAVRVRTGQLSASNHPVRTDTVADALAHVAAAHTMANHRDPRCIPLTSTIHPRITRLLRGFRKADSAPTRELPIPLPVLHLASSIAESTATASALASADLLWLAFYFLLRPGEYLVTGANPHPFTMADVRLFRDALPIDTLSASLQELSSATFVALIFSDQKNSVKGEVVAHSATGHARACPVKAIVRRLLHLRSHNAPPTTPLCAVGPHFQPVPPATVVSLLRKGGVAHAASTNSPLHLLHLKALRCTGASALLESGHDHNTIKLLGRWKSETALRYLHLQNRSLMAPIATNMLHASTPARVPFANPLPTHP